MVMVVVTVGVGEGAGVLLGAWRPMRVAAISDNNKAFRRRSQQRRRQQQAGQADAAEDGDRRDRGEGHAKESEAVTHGKLRGD